MKIKKYIQFIKESSQEDFHSLGEWVESLMEDEYVRNIVARYTQDSDADVDLSNAINVLDEMTKAEIKGQLEEYIANGLQDKDPDVLTSTDTEELMESEAQAGGKGIFSSFMKSITALGHKEMVPNWEKCPSDYLIFYYYKDLDAQLVKQIFERFKSLVKFSGMIDYGKNEVSLYYGIKCDGTFEYGIAYDELIKFGQFKLSQSIVKWVVSMDIMSASSLKKELVNLTYADIVTLGKIKNDMNGFEPGYHEKKSFPTIQDKVISFGYYGIGTWNNGKLDENEFVGLKNKFTTWLLTKKWGNKVLISVQPSSFWLYIHIKLK
jgi:hypothetical protein